MRNGMQAHRLLPLLLIAVIVTLALSAKPTAGQTIQTGTPTPTPTAISVLPSGRSLLLRAEAATERLGTYHEVEHQVVVQPNGSSVVLDIVTDASNRRDRERIIYTTEHGASGSQPGTTSTEAILVGHLEATRTAQGAWDCVDWNKRLPGLNSTNFGVSEPVGIAASRQARVTLIGTETRDGVPVWHVRVVQHVADHTGGDTIVIDFTVNYYIAQSDDTPREQDTITIIHDNGGTSRVTDMATFSEYGRAFHINLPRACTTFHAPLVPNLQPLYRKAARLIESRSVHLSVHYALTQHSTDETSIAEQVDRLPHGAGYRMSITRTVIPAGTRATPAVTRETSIRVGSHVATWTPERGWTCGMTPLAPPPHGPLRLPRSAAIVALAFRDNTSAWRVHVRYPNHSGQRHATATEDVFISDFRPHLVRSVYRRTVRSGASPLSETLSIDYSHYGEQLTLRLPAKCGSPVQQALG